MKLSSPIARIYAKADRRDKRRRTVLGGDVLIAPGSAPDTIYLVVNGMFAVSDPAQRLVGLIGPGEMIGEMAIFARDAHRNQVVALRDSVVDTLSSARFLERAAMEPALMVEVARVMATRARSSRMVPPPVRTVLVSAISPGFDPMPFCHQLAGRCRVSGITAEVAAMPAKDDRGWLIRMEQGCDLVIIPAAWDQEEWAHNCRRQVDRVLLLARADGEPPGDCAVCESEPVQAYQRVDLVVRHEDVRIAGAGQRWASATHAARVFHVWNKQDGIDGLLRFLTGRSNGLVLSGGGARAFAHIGVVASLRAAAIPVDLVGGTSMGAIVAAGLACGWSEPEMDARMRRAFVETNPLDDVVIPMVALTRGRKVDARLHEHFGDRAIEDLDIPFFCVSTDLTIGRHRVHDRGRIDRALRASISLPGILPPVVEGSSVLVDGGVTRNLPTDVMRSWHDGRVIGSDVGRERGLDPEHLQMPKSWLRWFFSGMWRGGPPVVSVLMRSATITTSLEIERARQASDIYIMPELDDIEIRNWHAYPRAVQSGREAAASIFESRYG